MAGGITPEFLEELKLKCNIREVISRYVPVQKRSGNWVACCPFHNEKTPSFYVHEAQGYYHCFGCGVSGDAIKFVQEIESVSFFEAVKILADMYNMTMPEFKADPEYGKRKEKADVLKSLMLDANRFYFANLKREEEGKAAREYLLNRGLNAETCQYYRLGLSLGYDQLQGYMRRKGYTVQNLTDCGLVSGEKLGDAFANRIIVPILDAAGNVVAFGGRIYRAEDKDNPAKYKNSNTNAIFKKGNTVYGINFVKQAKREGVPVSQLILVEGYMDVIALGAAGIRNAVAGMGTALEEGQAREIAKISKDVLVCYDGDAAGHKATIKNIATLENAGIELKIVTLPEGKDPDETVRSEGAEAFRRYCAEALPVTDYKLKLCAEAYDLRTANGRAKYVSAAITVLSALQSAAEREVYLAEVSRISGASVATLASEISRRAVGKPTSQDVEKAETEKRDSTQNKSGRFVLNRLLNNAPYAVRSVISKDWFKDATQRAVAEWIKEKGDDDIVLGDVFRAIPEEEELNRIVGDIKKFENKKQEEIYYVDCLVNLANEALRVKLDWLNEAFKETAEADKRKEILIEIAATQKKLKSQNVSDKI